MSCILQIKNIKKTFHIKKSFFDFKSRSICALDNVSLDLIEGETLGIVGESGCGKTTLGKTIVRLYRPDEGQMLYKKKDITFLSESRLFRYRKMIQFIFQDPLASLNPRFTVGDIIREPLDSFSIGSKSERNSIIIKLLEKVELSGEFIRRYPHELSNGQRQRIGIARAIASKPSILIADEPVSSLDVTVQVKILNLFKTLQKDLGISIIFISHDLSIIENFADRVAVMYRGKIVEIAKSNELYNNPQHPYTRALISAATSLYTTRKKEKIYLEEENENSPKYPNGCSFCSRCFMKAKDCPEKKPVLKEVSDGHFVRCLLV
ncbi:ABC transporter ATP-binding protein [bacterium]|nr:ABC transporter ATP-binding protein [bacterium]